MDLADQQARIDALSWYHEFDFGNGLIARSHDDAEWHRTLNAFISQQLDRIDFRGKTVLDIGCWDGYWSFYVEHRGAASVVASDDFTQNWSNAEGILLAKQPLGSSIEIIPDLSVYNLTDLKRTFDVILCLGVYYHLWDPFSAFAQIRHCCHRQSTFLLEGNVTTRLEANGIYLSSAAAASKFTPTVEALMEMLSATYFISDPPIFMSSLRKDAITPKRDTRSSPDDPSRQGWRERLKMYRAALPQARSRVQKITGVLYSPPPSLPPPHPVDRVFVRCTPHEGPNETHTYRPPFGLHVYDSRFCDSSQREQRTTDR